MEAFRNSNFPMKPTDLMAHAKTLTETGRTALTVDWMRDVGNAFIDFKCDWTQMVPKRMDGSLELLNKFFGSACSLMSILLRGSVLDSLEDVLEIFRDYDVSFRHFVDTHGPRTSQLKSPS